MGGSAIRQIEEAIFLLRRQDMRAWSQYLLAAVPLLLTLLKFVHDMSSSFMASRCAAESVVCVLVFFWASAWKAKFGGTLLTSMNGSGASGPHAGFWRVLCLQCILQTFKLVILPFAMASVLPSVWVSSFFRNTTIEASLPDSRLSSAMSRSAKRANLNASASWLSLAILIIIAFLTFLNVYILVGLLPFLLRMFSGVETDFTRSITSLFTFNVVCVVVALTWFIIDPLLLSCAVVRCFYAEARTDGRDLLAQLRPAASLLLVALAFASARTLSAETPTGISVSKEQLSRAVQHAAQNEDYVWLRAQKPTARKDNFFAQLSRDVNEFFGVISSWLANFRHWLEHLFEKQQARQCTRSHPTLVQCYRPLAAIRACRPNPLGRRYSHLAVNGAGI